MVVVPIYLERDLIGERAVIIKNNLKYAIYVPPIFIILMITAIFAIQLSEHLTFLKWGWLGENIIATPIADASQDMRSSGDGNSGIPILSTIIFIGSLFVMFLAFIIFNYDEEELFRDSWSEVVYWALLHLIMGIPIFAVIPIFSVGVIYKKIKDWKGQNVAFTVHFLTNTTLVLLIVLLTIIGMFSA
jgi:hypothetical protein